METGYEIVFSDEKFRSVGLLRDLLSKIDELSYCSFGSFLSSIHFSRKFSSTFELLVEDEPEVLNLLSSNYTIDRAHGTIELSSENQSDGSNAFKVRIVDAAAKNEILRRYLIENSDIRTCLVSNKDGDIEKFDIKIPRRGPTIISLLLEKDDSPQSTSEIVEKIVWSLTNVGVAPLLRESRFIPKDLVYQAADIIEEIFVARANKTASLLHTHASSELKSITSAELKKLGRPYAALLRA